jgi:hypothetical protein
MEIPKKLKLEELLKWCQEGCEDPGPHPKVDAKGRLQAALGALHFLIKQKRTAVWNEGNLKAHLYDVNVHYRQFAQDAQIPMY